MQVSDKISTLKGIGKTKEAKFNKKSVETIEDLLRFYPRRYEIFEAPNPSFYDSVNDGKPVIAVVSNSPKIDRKSGKSILKVTMKDKLGNIFSSTWFNVSAKALGLQLGKIVVLVGKCQIKDDFKFITQPTVYDILEYEKMIGKPVPVYSQSEGLKSGEIRKAVNLALSECKDYDYNLPPILVKKHSFPALLDTLKMEHDPKDLNELKLADSILAYEELFNFVYDLKEKEVKRKKIKNTFEFNKMSQTMKVIENIPFEFTKGQKKAVNDIFRDLKSDFISNRLVQGDVGCGKTLVAAISLLYVLENGYQGVMLAPTEVLATQHFEEIRKLAKIIGYEEQIRLITSSTSQAEKKDIAEEAEYGLPTIFVGTHSLFNLEFSNNLALVVIDEQHKFGVKQRESLLINNPHVVNMTATPIPRSISLTIYGDIKVSEIKEVPKGRIRVKNCVIDKTRLKTAFDFIANEIEKKHKVYIVCPSIDEKDDNLISVEQTKELVYKYLPKAKVLTLSGKTSPKDKSTTISEFKRSADILIATTVVEVGVSVSDATTIMIMNAERFGLSTLHQLRGRVGRGNLESYCIFVDMLNSDESKERMDIISNTNDGFKIALADLEMRGPGDLLGVEQAGKWKFKKAKITNMPLLNMVTKDVKEILY